MYLLILEVQSPNATNTATVMIKATKKTDFTVPRILNTVYDEDQRNIIKACMKEDMTFGDCSGFGCSGSKRMYVQGHLHSSGSQFYKKIMAERPNEVLRLRM